jgi:hypothetical protein
LRVEGIADLLDAFHRLNPDGPHFRCLQSRYGLHIVPEFVRDSSGRRARADSILEKTVSVPQGTRTAYEHLALLCSAVSAASGVPVHVNARSFPEDYAANGLVPPLLIEPTQEQLRPYGFSWGASAVTGREALISLLEGSATTVYWDLRCETSVDNRNWFGCFLNAGPLVVYVKGSGGEDKVNKTLRYDRCTVCPPLGQPLPPPPSVRDFVPKLDPPRQGK